MRGPVSLLLVLTLACGFAAAQGKRQSDSQDDNIPVLKRRPPADDAAQSTGAAPENAPSQPANGPDQTPPTNTNSVPPAPAPQGTSTVNPHADHHSEVMRHGAEAMGFDQETTTHHFLLTRSGGVVRITANDPGDSVGAGQISIHLRDAATRFAQGDFSGPEHTHGQVPPGVAVMRQLRHKIIYTAHAISGGAELIITSEDARAVNAIHDFLQFQIRDHQTGDSLAVR
jgi:hypothetical protein